MSSSVTSVDSKQTDRELPLRTQPRVQEPTLTLLEALLCPRSLTERGRCDEDEPALRHVHRPQVPHHAP